MSDISYTLHGRSTARTPVLLTHGFGASQAMWAPNLDALAADRRILTWDLPGHGASASSLELTHDGCVADMLGLLDALDTSRAVVGGMSLGGYLSLLFCARHPERVAALLLVDTGPGFRDDAARDAWNAWVGGLADDLEARGLAALPRSPESAAAQHAAGAAGLAAAARAILTQRDEEVLRVARRHCGPQLDRRGRRGRSLPGGGGCHGSPHSRRQEGPHRGRRPCREHGPARGVRSRGRRVPGGHVMQGLTVSVGADHVATVEFDRPPNNHFDVELIAALADAYVALDEDPACRAIVLCSCGRHFCAGANFAGARDAGGEALYAQAVRLFAAATPVVAAVQGAAIGGGLGLALSADFRVASPSSRFAANFARLGIHHGFGMTVTLPAAVGTAGRARVAVHGPARHWRAGVRARPLRSSGRRRGAAQRGPGARGRDRRLRAAGREVDPPDHAWRPARSRARGDAARGRGTGRAVCDRGLSGGRSCNRGAPDAALQRSLTRAASGRSQMMTRALATCAPALGCRPSLRPLQ